MFIAHRGSYLGPNPAMENHPDYIQQALDLGYDAEVDVWKINNEFFLGHDKPMYKVPRYFFQRKAIWTHCKNIEAFVELSKYSNVNCFLQEHDEMAITSQGFFWAHSKCSTWGDKTIMTSLNMKLWEGSKLPYGICSDYFVENAKVENKRIFDLLIIDIDGVMTDGKKIYDRDGKVSGKTYCDLDFTAIKRFLAAGIKVCFLSGDQIVNKSMAESRKIPFYHNTPGVDKIDVLPIIKKDFNAKTIAYVGDDYYDTSIMNSVDYAFCPPNAINAVKRIATTVNVEAGHGVIAGIYDLFEDKIRYAFPVDSKEVNPK